MNHGLAKPPITTPTSACAQAARARAKQIALYRRRPPMPTLDLTAIPDDDPLLTNLTNAISEPLLKYHQPQYTARMMARALLDVLDPRPAA